MPARRKFREGVWDGEGGVEEQLRAEKLRQPQGAVYVLGCKLDRPGAFYLAFIINRNPHREYFTVMPDGFYFRRRVCAHARCFAVCLLLLCRLPGVWS